MNFRYPAHAGRGAAAGHCSWIVPNGLAGFIWALFIALTAISGSTVRASESKAATPASGVAVPFSNLVTMNGEPMDEPRSQGLQIGQGKWTLVMIWVTNCHICKEQKPKISAFHNEHKGIDASVFGIAMDGAGKLSKVKDFIVKHKVTFPNFVGDMMGVMKDYEKLTNEPFRGTPTYLLFNPDGVLKGNNPGPVTISALESFIERHSQ